MRADLRIVAAFAVLAEAAAAQQTTPRTTEEAPPRVEQATASEQEAQSPVEDFLDWLKRNADEPKRDSGHYSDHRGGGDGGGDGAGGGDH